MLTQQENDVFTRVGSGTLGGELLRRYWYPVAVVQELTDESPTKFVRLLGENLVLFKDKSGRVGLLADRCAHRSASLVYGRVEERGIACAYHGWLYDCDGNILETPPGRNDAIMRSVKQVAYPVRHFIGFYWAYLGPLPPPEIPPYDVWTRRDGRRSITVYPRLDCNWFQITENAVDPVHVQILHQGAGRASGDVPVTFTTRGNIDLVESYDFSVTAYGIMKHRVWKDGRVDDHPFVFPNILRQGNRTQIRVPLDDMHTDVYFLAFDPTEDGSAVDENEDVLPVEYLPPFKTPGDALHPQATFMMEKAVDAVLGQDHMAWETQGPITDRGIEHLAYSDRGLVLLRRLWEENAELARRGDDPLGVIRDPHHPIIDTNLQESLGPRRAARVGNRR